MSQLSKISTTIVTKALIAGIFLITCFYDSAADSGEKYISGQLFVKVNDASSESLLYPGSGDRYPYGLKEIVKKFRVTGISKAFILNDPKLSKTYLLRFDKHGKTPELISKLSGLHYIEYAERVPLYKTSLTPNDLHPNQWYLPQIQAEAAWDITTGSASVVIAIVDDAVLISHEDLAPVIWVNPGEIPGNGIDDEPNGYIDDINGWDAADNDNDPNPVNPTNSYFSHGTHCAGIAAAATDNGIGIASVSYNVKLMAVKTAFNGWGSVPAALQGVEYAIAAKANIISMSWGGGPYSQTYQNVFDAAHNQGIVLIAAAGNDNTDILAYPASYNHVISVGATNSSDQRASFSNYGDSIDVMAPGQAIWSCKAGSNSSYDYNSGTSMACPLVSSLAALMLSWDPTLTPDELEACLKSSCDNIDAQNPGYIGQIGAGRINAEQALLCLKPINADFTSDFVQVCPGDTVQFTDLSSNNPTSWLWIFPGGFPGSSTLQNPQVIYSTAGVYDVFLSVTNANGTDTVTKSSYITVAVPTATISGNSTIPAGFSVYLKVDLTGNPNWSITYFDGISNTTINNITNTPYYINVSPSVTTTYTLVSVTDNGCGGTVSGNAEVTVIVGSGCSNTSYFQKTFGGTNDDEGITLALTADGGSIIGGTTQSFGAGNLDIYIIKLNACGYTEWTKTYGGTNLERGTGILQTMDGGFIISGYTLSFGAGNLDYLLIKTDYLGNVQWSNSYGLSGADYPRAIQQTPDGGYIIGGVTTSIGAGSNDYGIFKVDESGALQWNKSYGNSASDFLHDLDVTPDGGFILSGYRRDYIAGNNQAYLIKTDSTGNVQWAKTYSGSVRENAQSITVTDNGYLISGITNSFGAGNYDIMLINLDSMGNIIWSNAYGGALDDFGNDAVLTPSGEIYILGTTLSYGSGGSDLYLMKIDSTGTVLSAAAIGEVGDEAVWGAGNKMKLTQDGNILIAGWTNSMGAGLNDVYLIKTDAIGDALCNDSSQFPTVTVIAPTVLVNTPSVSSTSFTQSAAAVVVTNPPTMDSLICGSTPFPTICLTLQPGAVEGKDVILNGRPSQVNNNFGIHPDILASAWTYGGIPGVLRTLIEFDLSVIPNGAAIISADLSLFFNPTSANAGHSNLSGPNTSILQRVTSSWDEMTVTWNTQPTTTTGNEVTLAQSISNTQDYPDIDVTALVQDMVNNPSTSFGFMIRLITESYYRSLLFASSDNADSTNWPKLEICYVASQINPIECLRIVKEQKISDTQGNFGPILDDNDHFGQGLANIGDFNGDGIPDMVASATWDDDGGPNKGAIYMLFMTDSCTVDSSVKISATQGGFTGGIMDAWGVGITEIGDLNNDGVTDLAVGEPRATDLNTRDGAVWILFMKSNGTVDSYQKISQTQGNLGPVLGSDYRFGQRIAHLGDIDGDSISDIAVGVIGDNDGGTKRGAVWILFLDTNGMVKSKQKISSTAGNFLGVLDDFDRMGQGICTIGDINQDGVVDIAVGVRNDDDGGTDRGAIWIMLLNSDGTVLSQSKISSTQGGFTGSLANGVEFGVALSNMGDLDGNGTDDLLVGSHGDDDGGTNRGAAWILYMNPDATVKSSFKISSTQGGFAGPLDDGDIMGWDVIYAGDIDGDGYPEIALGASRDDDGGTDRGGVWILSIKDTCQNIVAPDSTECNITANFSADTVCLGDSTRFTDLSVDSLGNIIIWKWYFGDGDSTIGVQNPKHLYTTADTFSVILIIVNDTAPACFDTVVKQVLVLDTLFIKAPPDASICIGDSIQLSPLIMICGAAPYTYNWTPTASLSDPTIANPNAGPLVNTTYYITVTDSGGMISTDSVTITIDTNCCISWAEIGSDTNYCAGDTVYFSNNSISNGVATYDWDFGPSAIPTSFIGATPPPVYFSLTGAFQVMLILTDSCGVDTGYHTVNIFPAPIADAGADTTLCRFDTVQIGSIPISSHSYIWNPTIGLSDSVVADPYAYADSSLTYVVIITSTVSGCTSADSVTITRYPATQADAGIDTSHCLGDSLQLNASGGFSYVWTPATGLSDDSIADPWVIVNDTTTYFVTVTDSNSCIGMDSVTLRVNPLPNADAGADTSYCAGDSVQLNASGGVSYVWTPSAGLSDDSIADPWASISATTIYLVTVKDSNNCTASDTITVSVNALPVVDAGIDTSFCAGDSVQLNASGGITYTWSPANNLSDFTIQNPWASPPDTTVYYVSVVDSMGCSNMDSVVVSVITLPLITAGADTTICSGSIITLSAISNGTYLWSTGDTTKSIIVSPAGDSLYIVSTNNACGSVLDSIWVMVNSLTFADAGLDVTILLGNSTQLLGLPSGTNLSYFWSPFTGLSCSACQYPTANPENTTTYYLTVTDSLGCTAVDMVIVTVDKTMVIFIPNIFSPNGDGENDFFYIQGLGVAELKMLIFDRWGEKVFENTGFTADDQNAGWDGTYKGKLMNPAVFMYIVTGTFIDGSEIDKKGDLTLVK